MMVACAHGEERQVAKANSSAGSGGEKETTIQVTMRLLDTRDHQVSKENEAHARRLGRTETSYQRALREERLRSKYEAAVDRDTAAKLVPLAVASVLLGWAALREAEPVGSNKAASDEASSKPKTAL